ncbi:PPM-type phosphatase domain-containing protein, partial [Durusdinium trenchii]
DPIPLSAPSWATLLTGQRAAVHRITSNDLDSLLSTDSQGRLLVQPSDCLCTPVRSASCFASAFSQAKRQKLANPASPFPPTLFHFLSQNGCSAKLLNVGWPGVPQLCADATGQSLEVKKFGDEAEELDKAVEEMLKLLQENQELPEVLALYTHSVDLAGHVHGFSLDVPEYLESIEHFDACLGRLLDALADRHEDWLLAITTDHGGGAAKDMSKDQWSLFVEDCKCIHKGLSQAGSQGVHGLQDSDTHNTRFVILSGLNARPGEICPPPEAIDFLPTLLRHLGLASDSLPGRSRGLRRD